MGDTMLAMSSREQVPNELWLDIFRYLPTETIKELTLTYTRFKGISRPLLFDHFDFCANGISRGLDFLPESPEFNRLLERLDFWCSAEIAPHVRSCKICPWQKMAVLPNGFPDSAHTLLFLFLERLGRFTGLQSLHARGVYLTQSGIANMCRAPALFDVQLVRCSIAPGQSIDTTSLNLGVSKFSFTDGVTDDGAVGLWLPLLRTDFLRTLELVCHPRIFGEDMAAIPSFPHMHKLTITLNLSTMSYNLAILSKFPAVQSLSVSSWGEIQAGPGAPMEPSDVLPVLRRYTGSCETIALFAQRSTLTHLSVQYCPTRDFTTRLHDLQGPSCVTSLDVTFDNLDMATLGTLCAVFPSLTELRIGITCEIEEDDFVDAKETATEFFAELKDFPTLPGGLQRLAITWKFEYEGSDGVPFERAIIPDFSELRDALVARCPALTTLWLDGEDYLFDWRKSVDGVEKEFITADEDEARERRKESPTF